MARVKHAPHHGGAWKVAYADFVTAMMALFMVLWITSQDKQILLATSKYFKQPFNAMAEQEVGVTGGRFGSAKDDDGHSIATPANQAFLHALAKQLNRMLSIPDGEQDDNPVSMQVTSDGLKITIFDRNSQPLFEKNTAKFTDWGLFIMQNLAWMIERNNLKACIDGHAASGTKMPDKDYGLWELTADRANAARRTFEKYAVRPEQIERVTGYADTRPVPGAPSTSEINQRITVSLAVAN